MSKADEVELKEIQKDRAIIREAQTRVATCIAFDQLVDTDKKLYRRYQVLSSIIAGKRGRRAGK